jgi:thiol-disulfide isomerase/thioredoxin
MKIISTILGFFFSFISLMGFAQTKTGHEIKVKLNADTQGRPLYLAHYFGNSQYIKVDSAKAENGIFTFKGEEKLKGGLYLLVVSPSKFYDVLITGDEPEQFMQIEADTTDFAESVRFKTSKENDILYDYRRFLQQKNQDVEAIQLEAKLKNDVASRDIMQAKMKNLQEEVAQELKKTVEKNKGSFATKIIKANIEPEFSREMPLKADGKPDSSFLFNSYKNSFFDNIDFSDERLTRTPFLQNRLERYFRDLVYQVNDSVIVDCDKVLKKAKANKDVYRYVLWWTTNRYETTEIVGLDGVFIHLAENYYLQDADWLDSTQRAKFKERISILKPLQTGLVFPNLEGSDGINGAEIDVNKSDGKYTVVVFYSPDCGHCKDSAPKLVEFYNQYKDKGIRVYNVSTDYEVAKIKKFVETYKTEGLINMWDSKGKYYFRNNFDVYSTPTTFVLDDQKRIIGKRIPIEELGRFIDFQERKKTEK